MHVKAGKAADNKTHLKIFPIGKRVKDMGYVGILLSVVCSSSSLLMAAKDFSNVFLIFLNINGLSVDILKIPL